MAEYWQGCNEALIAAAIGNLSHAHRLVGRIQRSGPCKMAASLRNDAQKLAESAAILLRLIGLSEEGSEE